ncbi:Zinc finger, C2H2-type/integrase, DNA-binding protein [Cordyceps fumosorosea ARSEF 2679]|uniref:Zinc finger, C2H2-type/integrase, DNA-binding protein n=1 Tax=Cordyceps fumosorosea (strain ARSEF 2679) TaxID=1081104 RepID=A0A168B0Z2_CORFA|nr:Zinc finger, C2H2-type/integrase, DNA-binding protein [Cordyceps fumosorosea ARSEF 2679]OAA69463.1 Zinc finger, C2H2-type/integrase, DNA-binding protein [Cordyceps fumosorosea ARSEF 2679]
MNKRSAETESLEAYPAKRPHNDTLDSTYPIIDAGEDDITTAETPNSFAGDVDSPLTVATTPRARFPSDLKTLPCTWPGCPKTFNRPARLRDHLNSHTNSRPFKCTYEGCDKDYIEDKHLKQHIKAVHTNERSHVCPREGCGKTFVTGTRLKRHQAVHEGADRFRCAECGQSFRKKETLHKHVLKAHRGEAPHQCAEPGCDAKFESKGALKRHHQRVHGELKFWCSDCAVSPGPDGSEEKHIGFTTQALLQAHMRAEHQDCMFCEFRSSSQAEMVAHVDARHSGKTLEDRRAHACDRPGCAKSFTKRSNLRAHQRIAHDGFRFVCGEVDLAGVAGLDAWRNADGCGDKFCTKVRLEDHVRYVHLRQERPAKPPPAAAPPPTSDGEGATAEDLIEELSGVRTQSKKTVACPHCPQAFARYYDLELHVAATHVVAAPEGLFAESAEGLDQGHFIEAGGMLGSDDGVFAAEMHYGAPRDEWLDDQLGIMMLARDSPALETPIDPTLGSV